VISCFQLRNFTSNAFYNPVEMSQTMIRNLIYNN
jgi:hypothetical protein